MLTTESAQRGKTKWLPADRTKSAKAADTAGLALQAQTAPSHGHQQQLHQLVKPTSTYRWLQFFTTAVPKQLFTTAVPEQLLTAAL